MNEIDPRDPKSPESILFAAKVLNANGYGGVGVPAWRLEVLAFERMSARSRERGDDAEAAAFSKYGTRLYNMKVYGNPEGRRKASDPDSDGPDAHTVTVTA